MTRPERSPLLGSLFSLALVAVALVLSFLIRPYLEPDTLLFLVAVWLSAWYYGRAYGFLALGASAVTLVYFFLSGPVQRGAVPPRLASLVVIGAAVTWVTASWRASRGLLVSTLASIGDAV